MTARHVETNDPRIASAIEELRDLILRHFPGATFSVSHGHDDPEIVHLNATVEVDDLDRVVDLTIERELELQVDEGVPVYVIPRRPSPAGSVND